MKNWGANSSRDRKLRRDCRIRNALQMKKKNKIKTTGPNFTGARLQNPKPRSTKVKVIASVARQNATELIGITFYLPV